MARSLFRRSPFRIVQFLLGAACALSLVPTLASAQSTATGPAPQDAATQSTGAQDTATQGSGVPVFFDTVVVTASRDKELNRDVTSNVTVIGQNDIEASTAKTVADLLVEHGFNSASYNDVAGVQIRGFGQLSGPPENTNTVLVLLNGRRTGNANLTLMGLENVDHVEIIRGPSAVQYGSSAMGGVINIITKRGTAEPTLSFEAGGGSDSLNRETLAFSGAAKGLDFSLGATNYGRSDLTTAGGRIWYHSAIEHDVNVDADLGYALNANNRAGVTVTFGDIQSQLSSGTGGIRPYSADTPDAPFTAYRKRTENIAFSYTGNTPKKDWDWSASYAYGDYNQKPYANDLGTKFFNAQAGRTAAAFSASFGVDDYQYQPVGSLYGAAPASWTMNDAGIYATGKARALADRFVFTAGLRFDAYDNTSAGLSSTKNNHAGGTVGVAYLPKHWLKLRTNYADGFKVPAPPQVAGDGAIYYLPNASLKPEDSRTFEFGSDVAWKYTAASVTWFHADWDNKIIALTAPGACSGGFGCYQYQNLKSSTLAGMELELRTDVAKAAGRAFSLEPDASFTWLQTRRNNDASQFIVYDGSPNDTLPNTPDWMVTYGVKYAEPAIKLTSALNVLYYGDVLTQDWGVVDYVTVFTAPYIHRPTGTVVNLSVDKDLAALSRGHDTLSLRVEIQNLLDGANEMYWGYPGPGRSFYLGLRYNR